MLRRAVQPLALALLAALVAGACADSATPTSLLTSGDSSPLTSKSGNGGGAAVPGPATSPVPTTPPAPDVLMRESFAENGGARAASGDGALKATLGGNTSLKSFWIEYPGSKNTQWLASDVGQRFTFGGSSLTPNPCEGLASPYGCGAVYSFSTTFPTSFPTALVPIAVALPSGGYEYSMKGWPETTPGAYIAIGFTNSAALASNLTSGGSLWVKVTDPTGSGLPLHFELRTGSLTTGKLLAEGDRGQRGWNRMALRVSPAAGTVTLNFGTVATLATGEVFSDTASVTVPLTIPQPKYLAFEGIGVLTELVLWK
jgi:hypothetical protein